MNEDNKVMNSAQSINVFSDSNSFAHAQRVAQMLSKSDLVPATFKNNVGNCVIAMEMAMRIQASPLMVMQNMYVVHGKPAWSSQFLIACINASGKFSPLRYEEKVKEGEVVPYAIRAYAIDKSNNDVCHGTWVTMQMAQDEGWMSKAGSKWKTMPELMLRYRSASFFQRQFCPEISMGFHTKEEIYDIGPKKDQNDNTLVVVGDSEVMEMISNAIDMEELEEVYNDHRATITKDITLVSAMGKKKKFFENEANAKL